MKGSALGSLRLVVLNLVQVLYNNTIIAELDQQYMYHTSTCTCTCTILVHVHVPY